MTQEGYDMQSITDREFNAGTEMYRASVFPELFPHANTMDRCDNWPLEDRLAWLGGAEFKQAVLDGTY
jgi:hypothetical protein